MSPVDMVTEPTGSSLQRLAEAAGERIGDEAQLIFEGQRWSGTELAGRARRLSAGLRGAGLWPGDRVAVCMSNCPEVPVTYQAVWRAGGVVTPALFLLTADELRHVLADSEAALVVTTPEFLPKVQAAARGVRTLRAVVVADLEQSPGQSLEHGTGPQPPATTTDPPVIAFAHLEAGEEGDLVDADPSSPAALLYTGGTTGRSKGVLLSHDSLSSAAWAIVRAQFDENDGDPELPPLILPLPLSHIYGLIVNVAGMHTPRGRVSVLMRWFDPVAFLDLVEAHRVGAAAVVPSMLQLLLQQPLEDRDLSTLTRVSSGSAPLPREVAEALARRIPGVEISEGYGCTETTGIISTSPKGKARPGSVGLPSPGVRVRIERPDGSEAATGENGEICVQGSVLMTKYWRAEAETTEALRDGWLHTGDIGHLDGDGYLFVVDRIKDLIIRGGFNVYPRDVEEVLIAHPDVIGAAVIGRPDQTYGEEVVAYVRLRAGAERTSDDLVAYAKEHLSAAKYPREIRIVDEIPLTSIGKIDRKRLHQGLTARP